MKTLGRLPSHKVVPKFYNSNPYHNFASLLFVMVTWNGNIYKIKKS
jgi:hypothetical protein